jgi:hypothetical protein
MVQDIQRILDLTGGVIFIWPPLFKLNIFSKYTPLTSWIRTRIMHAPWLIIMYDGRTVFSEAVRHSFEMPGHCSVQLVIYLHAD